MDFYQELLLTAIVSILLTFLIGKLAAAGSREVEADLVSGNPEAPPVSSAADDDVGLHPIEKELPAGKPSGDHSGTGGALAEPDRAEVTVGEGVRLVDLEDEKMFDVVPGGEESSAKKDDEFSTQEERAADDPEDEEGSVDEVAELAGEDVVGKKDAKRVMEGEKGASSLLHGEDDWEGIERSELEKLFGVAAEFVGSEKGADALTKLSNDVQMQLYGLQKVATEGPCYESQPMALKVSARSKCFECGNYQIKGDEVLRLQLGNYLQPEPKRHAWQRLGNMNPEVAMEQYITLLTDSFPGWNAEESVDEVKVHDRSDPLAVKVSPIDQSDSQSSPHDKSETEGLVGDSYSMEGATDIVATGPKLFKEGLTKLFLFNLISPTRVAF